MSDTNRLLDCTRLSPRAFYNLRLHTLTQFYRLLNVGLRSPDFYATYEYQPSVAIDPSFRAGGDISLAGRYTGADRLFVTRAFDDRALAVIDIASPGDREDEIVAYRFVKRCVQSLQNGASLLLIDPLPEGGGQSHNWLNAIQAQLAVQSGLRLPPVDSVPQPPFVLSISTGTSPRIELFPLSVGGPLPDISLSLPNGPTLELPLSVMFENTRGTLGYLWDEVIRGVREPPVAG